MKRRFIIPLFVFMLLLAGCSKAPMGKSGKSASSVSSTPQDAKPTTAEEQIKDSAIEWKDKKLEEVIRKLINKPEGDIMISDVHDIEKLDCSNAGITSVYDLMYFDNLKEADFSHNGLVNFGSELPVNLNQLVKLNLSYNHIESFDLSHTPHLQYLNLQENKIKENLSGLAGGKELTYLNLNDAVEQYGSAMYIFGDISALSGLTKLTFLDLGNILTIEDYSCLSKLTSLQELSLENTNIKNDDLEFLKGMKELTKLNIKNNENASLTKAIKELTNLKVLYAKCEEEDGIFENLKNMEELNLECDDSTLELDFLKSMPNLKKLTITDAEIDDPSPLTKLSGLTYLDLTDTYVIGTECFSKMTQLEELYYSPGRPSGDYSTVHVDISGLTKLKCLSLKEDSGETDFNVSQLKNMKDLRKLELSTYNNPGLDKLKNMPQIKELSVCLGEEYDNLNFLKSMGQLTFLYLDIDSDFPAADYTPLEALTNLKELTIRNDSEDSNNMTKVISRMKQLTTLMLQTPIKNINFIKNLTNLDTLAISAPDQEEAVDISLVADLQKLKNLDVSYLKIDDISVLDKSKSLSTLYYRSDNEPGKLSILEKAIPALHLEETTEQPDN